MVTKKVLFITFNMRYLKERYNTILEWLYNNKYEIHIASYVEDKIKDYNYYNKYFGLGFTKSKIKKYCILKRIIKENKYDIIHCFTPFEMLIVKMISKKSKSKVIYVKQDSKYCSRVILLKKIFFHYIEKYLLKYTDVLIVENKDDYCYALNKFKYCKVELICGLGIDFQKVNTKVKEEDRKKFLEEFSLKQEDYVFFSKGNLNRFNNHILQIEAVMQILPGYKNIKLLIEGDGPLEEFYNNIIEKYRLTENIKFIGQRKDLQRLICLSDCFLITSKRENNKIDIINAMFLGKSIIASRIKSYKELLDDKYLVSLKNSNELIDKMEKNIIGGSKDETYDIGQFESLSLQDRIKRIYDNL